MQQRIIGTELEYAAEFRDANGQWDQFEGNSATFSHYIPPEYAGLKDFLRNGSRLYLDIGQHPEYAASEETSIIGAVANELAGDRIMYATMQAINQARRTQYEKKMTGEEAEIPPFGFQLNRRVVDYEGKGWGYHENYSCDRRNFDAPHLTALLAMHIMTRNTYAGAGTLMADGTYALAQKALMIDTAVDPHTTRKKALILSRDEPHAESSLWGRVCVVGGDPHMSPWSAWMQLGTTALVIELAEQGYELPHLYAKPGTEPDIARHVATDLTLKRPFTLADGTDITAVDAQWDMLQAVQKMIADEKVELSPEYLAVAKEWERTLTTLETDPMQLRDRADGQAHLRDLERFAARHSIDWAPDAPAADRMTEEQLEMLRQRDYRWDSLHASSIGKVLRERSWQQWMPDADLVDDRVNGGAEYTRAGLRSRFIHGVLDKGYDEYGAKADWQQLQVSESIIMIKNPFAYSDARVDTVLGSLPHVA